MTTHQQRIAEAIQVLQALGMPKEQLNERTAITLLALLNLPINHLWHQATNPQLGIRAILDFARQKMDRDYAENTRESVRKYSVKQMVAAGILLRNPDKPDRSVNSADTCYQIDAQALALLQLVGTEAWDSALSDYLSKRQTLADKFARQRDMHRIPVNMPQGQLITLSPGAHSDLIRQIIEVFAANFVPGGELVYVGDTGSKWGYFNQDLLQKLGVVSGSHGKMPDVVLYHSKKKWLVLVEAVTSTGPVDGLRHTELADLFKASTAGLVYVTAFPDRGETMRKFLSVVAWETEVWCASDPTHLIHFNGERFLGPY